jgi:hypothetical protein
MLTRALLATTALVLCLPSSFAGQQTGNPGGASDSVRQLERGAASTKLAEADSNARFLSWYGRGYHLTPPNGGQILYDQSASSGFAEYAVPSWENDSAPYTTPDLAADDFIIPGNDTHKITAVYAAGVIQPADDLAWVNVIFFSDLKYDRKTGATTAVVKATCPGMPFSDETGTGDLLVDVSSCDTGRFRGGHDYAVSVQPESADSVWYWQTNRKQLNRPGFWWDDGGGGNGSCYTQLTPIKTCFPTKGYGPDLAFAIIGN